MPIAIRASSQPPPLPNRAYHHGNEPLMTSMLCSLAASPRWSPICRRMSCARSRSGSAALLSSSANVRVPALMEGPGLLIAISLPTGRGEHGLDRRTPRPERAHRGEGVLGGSAEADRVLVPPRPARPAEEIEHGRPLGGHRRRIPLALGPGGEVLDRAHSKRVEIRAARDLVRQWFRDAVARAVREHEVAALEPLEHLVDVLDRTQVPQVLEPDRAAAHGREAREHALLAARQTGQHRGRIERACCLGERPPLVPRAGRRLPDPPRMPAERVAERLGLDALLRRQRTADLLLDDRERELELQARELDRLAVPEAPRGRRDHERATRRRREDGLRLLALEPEIVDDDERAPVVQRASQAAARGPHGRVAAVVELLEERLQDVVERGVQRVDVDEPVRERGSRRVVRDVREQVRLADPRLAVDVHDSACLRGGEDDAGLALTIDVLRVAARPRVDRNGQRDRVGDLTEPVQQRAVDSVEPDLQVDVVAGDDDAVADVAADDDAPLARRAIRTRPSGPGLP